MLGLVCVILLSLVACHTSGFDRTGHCRKFYRKAGRYCKRRCRGDGAGGHTGRSFPYSESLHSSRPNDRYHMNIRKRAVSVPDFCHSERSEESLLFLACPPWRTTHHCPSWPPTRLAQRPVGAQHRCALLDGPIFVVYADVAPASSRLFVFKGSELQLRHSAANKISHLQRLPARYTSLAKTT